MEESQAKTLTKILEQLIGENDDNETNAQNYQRIINSIESDLMIAYMSQTWWHQ